MASPSARYGAIKRKIRERGVIPTSEVTVLREGKGMILVISKKIWIILLESENH